MAPHSITLAWKIPWMEESGRLQSMGSLRVGHDWSTCFHFSLSCIGEGNGNPLQGSCLKNPRDGGAWWAAVYGVAQSRTRLKWLSSSSSRNSKVSWHSTQAGSIPHSGGLAAALPGPPLYLFPPREEMQTPISTRLPVLPLNLWAKAKERLAPPLVPRPTLPRGKFSGSCSR